MSLIVSAIIPLLHIVPQISHCSSDELPAFWKAGMNLGHKQFANALKKSISKWKGLWYFLAREVNHTFKHCY